MDVGTEQYVAQEVMCADPVRLVELLYQRALRDLQGACELWPAPDRQVEAIHLALHAQLIIKELHASLNLNEGRELATYLSRLYEFMQYQLMDAISTRDDGAVRKVAEVIELLQPLSEAWSTMAREHWASNAATLVHGECLVA
jgi:flagellar biosynthetic protein FliS